MLLKYTNWVFPFLSSDIERFWIGPIYFNGVSFVISRFILAVLLHKTYDQVSKGKEQIYSHINQLQEPLSWTFSCGRCSGATPTPIFTAQASRRQEAWHLLTQRTGRWWTCTRYTSVPSLLKFRRSTTSSTTSQSLSC